MNREYLSLAGEFLSCGLLVEMVASSLACISARNSSGNYYSPDLGYHDYLFMAAIREITRGE